MSADSRHAIVEAFAEGRAAPPVAWTKGLAVTVGLWFVLLVAMAIVGVLFQNSD